MRPVDISFDGEMAQTSTSSLVEQEAKKLIQKLTSFKDSNDENFRRSLQFALSNFKFHRYLDVDSHKITRKLQGLFQKFEIHSQLEKAVSLRKLTDKFLQLPLSPKSRDAKTDLHYSVLSVLLNLSDSPVNATYTETQHVPKQREEDKFDWGAFLQEGLAPIPSFQDSSSDEWSEEEVLDDSAIQADQSETSPAALQHPIGHAVSGHPIRSQGFGEGHRGRSWLARNVIVQYWEGDRDSALQGLHSAASLASTWRAYEQQRDPFAPAGERYTLTETHIIRETIWVLMGAETSFVYQLHDSKFTSRQDIQVSHLTPKALHEFTSKLAETCTNAWTLQSFVDSIRAAPMSYIKAKDDPTRGQTFESFAEALSVMLWEFRKELTAWERDIAKQETSLTLSKFAADLEPWAKRLALLELVYQAGTARNEPASCAQSTWLLLTALQGTIEAEYEQGTHREENVLILLRVWLGTIRPYIHFLDNWLSGYPLCDPAQEFVIQRNPEITVKSPDFWEKAFTLHHFTPPSKHGTTQLPQSGAQPSGPDQRQKEGRVSAGHLERVAVPSFLQPVLRQILLAGKCMELLESMGQLSLVWRKYHPEKSTVYDDFSESVKKLLCPRSSDLAGEKTDTSHPQPSRNTSSAIVSLTELQNLGIRDPLMAHNFRDLFTELEYFSTEPCADNESWSSLPDFSSALTSHMKPLTLILHRCLYPLLMAKCQTICKELVVALKKDYHLTETFASMRRYYLCEAGDTMFDFLSDLFDKLRLCQHKSQWQDTLYLNYQLQTAVAAGYPSDADRLTVSFEPVNVPSTVSIQPIHALDGLTLHYKVPWPLDIIINAKTITAYNQVFRFLLQVKRAKYCLEQLRFSSTTTDPKDKPEVRGDSTPSARPQPLHKAQLLHRVFLLRFKLIHFVNAVHSYLMSRILHSTGLEFQADIERAPDLEAIVELHTTYLAKVSERCLLHKKVGLVREAVLKALNLALVFQRRWDAGLSAFNAERIDQMLSEFNKCSVFLLTMLDNINKRGAFPHLEALALSLTQSHEESSSTGLEEAQQTS
ncbi:gamma-tubulin complex component 5-like isoform X2 [Acanthaster planci]|uniref:Gamma-tubulin complex component n=1 Tax=Acanthaster planci TaxID=133434 RepID=A0A8B7YHK3_ACAPL|nr:gamma-tubulin complex component 5-like isoform X2 [Acanthaster planci]